jgi:cobalt-zinc-cadmium resistance protein CzcA
MSGLPKLQNMHSISKFGLSQVVLTFEDGTDIYFARQVATERLGSVQLPAEIARPKLGPVATGLGEVFHYVVTGKGDDVTELGTIHDWVIRPQMRSVPGTAEVNTWGGYEKQYQVRIDPALLIKFDITFDQVVAALKANNRNVGGGITRQNEQSLLVHGVGRVVNKEQIGNIVVTAEDGTPIRVRDVAKVEIGSEVRRGAVTLDGKGEVVLGLGFMTMGENSHAVTWAMKDKLDQIKTTLPRNVEVVSVYDRTRLVDQVIDTVRNNLFEAALLVVAVLFAFLGNLRAAAIVALAIPLSLLFAFSGMLRWGIAASLLSLGALDFGLIVDSSVVMVENCVRRLASRERERPESDRLEVVRDAAVEVRKPTLFGELIIMIVYLPILTLEGIEGKLFRPMALTVIFALLGSLVLSMTLMPVLASYFLPRRVREREPLLMRLAHAIHTPVLRFAMRFRITVLAFALCVLVVAFGMIAPNLGAEFVPRLSEGAIVIGTVRLPGTDIEESIRTNTQVEKTLLAEFPDEVSHVWSRIGSAEVATDPMGIELTDVYITLKPRGQWKRAATQAELTTLIERELRKIPGMKGSFNQPIEHRMNEMASGIRSDVGVMVYGDDLDLLVEKAHQVEDILKSIPGAADVYLEQVTGLPILSVQIRQDEIARYGIPATAVLDLIESVGSKPVSEVVEGQLRFPLVIRLPEQYRSNPDAIGSMEIVAANGQRVPVSRLADLKVVEGPSTITREWGQRRVTVTCNVRGRDLGSFVEEAQQRVGAEVTMPPGRYHINWGGQYEQLERARLRLLIVVPVAFLLIIGLLYATYGSWLDAFRVFTGVPFAWVGGIFALWVRGMPFSISAAIGFIALSGVAVLDDMILVSRVRQLRAKGVPIDEAVRLAAISRLRPVLMTALVASLGFVPMAFNTGVGSEVQRPLATVVIGGVIGSMVMSLLVLRVLYLLFSGSVRSKKDEVKKEGLEVVSS